MNKIHVSGYAQDEWKASRGLTINYGLRYNYFSPFTESHGNENPFDIEDCGGYCGMGADFYHPNYLSLDPRASVAFAPDVWKGNTVFRAGYSIYHGEVQLGDEDSPVVNTAPSTLLSSGIQSDGSSVQYSYPVPPSLTPSTGLALTPRSMARNRPDSIRSSTRRVTFASSRTVDKLYAIDLTESSPESSTSDESPPSATINSSVSRTRTHVRNDHRLTCDRVNN